MKPVAPLSVSLKPSRRLQLIQSVAHVVAAGAVLTSTIPSWLAVTLLILIGASLARMCRKFPVASLILHGDGRLETVCADALCVPGIPLRGQVTPSEAAVHPHTLVLSFLVVLLYRQNDRLRSLTLLDDSLAAEDFRQLRLWLRWRSVTAQPA